MKDENEKLTAKPSFKNELQNFKNINSSLIQDALNVWSDLWAELDSTRQKSTLDRDDYIASDNVVKTDNVEVFEPSCGWPEFLEKMWTLRNHLDFAKRLSQQ